jgi:hypothetical protein
MAGNLPLTATPLRYLADPHEGTLPAAGSGLSPTSPPGLFPQLRAPTMHDALGFLRAVSLLTEDEKRLLWPKQRAIVPLILQLSVFASADFKFLREL